MNDLLYEVGRVGMIVSLSMIWLLMVYSIVAQATEPPPKTKEGEAPTPRPRM